MPLVIGIVPASDGDSIVEVPEQTTVIGCGSGDDVPVITSVGSEEDAQIVVEKVSFDRLAVFRLN